MFKERSYPFLAVVLPRNNYTGAVEVGRLHGWHGTFTGRFVGVTFRTRLQRILRPKMPFFVRQKSANFVKNFATNPEFCQFFAIRKWGPFGNVTAVTAVNLFYEVLPKQFELLASTFLNKKGDCWILGWVSWTFALLALNHCVSWQIIKDLFKNIPEFHMVKLMT